VPTPGHPCLVPRGEDRLILLHDFEDPPGETLAFSLDEVPNHLINAPLAHRRVPGQDAHGQGTEL
jgi:hypothetical protein